MEEAEEGWLMRVLGWMSDFYGMVTCRGKESISDCCVSSVITEIQTAISKTSKTKENKAALASIQKAFRRMNPSEEHMYV